VLYDQLQLDSRISQDHRADISNLTKIHQVISTFKPEVIFHLAAQPLVRLSYEQPVETFATNVMGTVNLLEAVRLSDNPCTVLCVTTDKCYENKEWLHAYREEDPMGGHDPYSASKGAAELVIASYRRSFFSSPVPCSLSPVPSSSPSIRIASARAGNVLGGGDWAVDRIVPDCIRSIRAGQPIPVRNKIATRPWQHVLEPLSGYLHLAASLASSSSSLSENPSSVLRPPTSSLTSAFNFGPALDSNRTVEQLVIELVNHTGGKWSDASDPNAVHE
ncbi:MAG: CDP-glucose 4,6-dehydratase, partial [bacterium]